MSDSFISHASRNKTIDYLFVVLVILFAMWLRSVGIGTFGHIDYADFPTYAENEMLHIQAPVHPDEYFIVATPVDMMVRNSLNPKFFEYPSGLIYLNYFFFLVTGDIQREDLSQRVDQNIRTYAPFSFYFISRVWSVLGSTITVVCAFSIMRLVSGRFTGIAAAFLVATSYISIHHAHYAKPESLSTALMMISIWAAVATLYGRRYQYQMYIFSGICTGLATTLRYNAGSVVIFLVLAGLVLVYKHRTKKALLSVGIAWIMVPVMFLLGSPYVLLDFEVFYSQFTHIIGQFLITARNITPEAITEPLNGFSILFSYLVRYGTGITGFILAIIGIYRVLVNRSKNLSGASSPLVFVLINLTFLIIYMLVTMRTVRPLLSDNLLVLIIPQFLLLASIGVSQIRDHMRFLKLLAAPLAIIVSVIIPLTLSIPMVLTLATVDTRIKMQEWIYEYIPLQAKFLLVEPYNVPLDPALYPYSHNFNIRNIHQEDINQYDYIVLSTARLDLFADADFIISDDEYALFEAQLEEILSTYPLIAEIERYRFFGDTDPMNPARYWHHPRLLLFCINEIACNNVR
jgi:4-amino-4-deoxy-L-arabinose transferase-like glycosyltransferase